MPVPKKAAKRGRPAKKAATNETFAYFMKDEPDEVYGDFDSYEEALEGAQAEITDEEQTAVIVRMIPIAETSLGGYNVVKL